jgi:ABC-type antimicrobial peptide transport system permease subunit
MKRYVFDAAELSATLYAAVFAILLAIGTAAVIFPALRAARIDPIRILRGE